MSQFCSERIQDDTDLRFVFKFQGSGPTGTGKLVKRCVFGHKKITCVFRRHFEPVSQRAPNVCRGACHPSRRIRVKFRPNLFRFAGVTSEKWISYDSKICLRHNYNNVVDELQLARFTYLPLRGLSDEAFCGAQSRRSTDKRLVHGAVSIRQ